MLMGFVFLVIFRGVFLGVGFAFAFLTGVGVGVGLRRLPFPAGTCSESVSSADSAPEYASEESADR